MVDLERESYLETYCIERKSLRDNEREREAERGRKGCREGENEKREREHGTVSYTLFSLESICSRLLPIYRGLLM